MEQKLSRYQNLIVLLITLLLHAGIILSIIIMKFDHPQTEAMVVLAQDNEPKQYQTPQNDWVTMSQATQASQPSLQGSYGGQAPSAMPGTAADPASVSNYGGHSRASANQSQTTALSGKKRRSRSLSSFLSPSASEKLI